MYFGRHAKVLGFLTFLVVNSVRKMDVNDDAVLTTVDIHGVVAAQRTRQRLESVNTTSHQETRNGHNHHEPTDNEPSLPPCGHHTVSYFSKTTPLEFYHSAGGCERDCPCKRCESCYEKVKLRNARYGHVLVKCFDSTPNTLDNNSLDHGTCLPSRQPCIFWTRAQPKPIYGGKEPQICSGGTPEGKTRLQKMLKNEKEMVKFFNENYIDDWNRVSDMRYGKGLAPTFEY